MANDSSDERTADLGRRLDAVRSRLADAVSAAGRAPGDVELLVVTKFFPASDVARLITLGERQFGESREPEASRKVSQIHEMLNDTSDLAFDMIGSVQSKKAGSVARWARAVHSVDRAKIVDGLARAASAALDDHDRADPLGVLLQVSLDGDPLRGGILVEELAAMADRVEAAPALLLRGLMAIAPVEGSAEEWMARAGAIHQRFVADHPAAAELSAGMSGDLEAAVAHGSTCVRVGTAIMGPRPLISH